MVKKLLQTLTFYYDLAAIGRGTFSESDFDDIKQCSQSSRRLVGKVADEDDREARIDLKEADLIREHIDEMIVFQLSNGEIC